MPLEINREALLQEKNRLENEARSSKRLAIILGIAYIGFVSGTVYLDAAGLILCTLPFFMLIESNLIASSESAAAKLQRP
ncbi:hypothetical protein A3H89_01700 [Candidatus Amesbacteria bacterium RIFCSPLOWO2_02_FULL_48_11]|uniref:Uncharacterized protein n=2 Tax=Candidatus Amesiibacteriota TaxID=1752730 RepID=A0A1F4Z8I0_9BACT|nr:MAG: hypothetical protein UY22_C0035G0018 [Candidatus Amesbacteria bacterium GW2011_GWC1_48_10]OGC90660.1 MAG: hypothetical protein A2V48_04130 [Candidatus Amesbacteria bacterium RBG_19FT_COMBO_48_16]OGC96507.1 MAG: hypothetical protein A3C34_04740 [Candidatus Amesbacteria bacterium RIFCSPHIGHO2_02_FULL_48_21]OGD00636.1 MAG: hypothetical protein A2702_00540 [Candidatus Amesbacteria bacterium RIFCSPHIGHO2_01_FULL_48_75]OGD01735.1 MAG: hypothetical protein A2354_02525 [Candidatus Amesbacteria 